MPRRLLRLLVRARQTARRTACLCYSAAFVSLLTAYGIVSVFVVATVTTIAAFVCHVFAGED